MAKGNCIDLLRPDETGRMISVGHTTCFATIRSIMPFRLLGSNKDYLVIGSDSGKISICEFDENHNGTNGHWKVLKCETFGRTGCRRVIPGQYLACDPKGRAIMIGSIEKQRFVYVLNRDSENNMTISSPLEAYKNNIIVFSCVGLDVGLENPVFALLELDYTEADEDESGTGAAAAQTEKLLTYYELDLGLNHVVRKWCEPVSRLANLLIAVPGGEDGPGGVLVCGENWISYKDENHVEIRTPIPRRIDMPASRGLLITSGVLHKQKGMFFFILQSEYGDLYKVELRVNEEKKQQAQMNKIDTSAGQNDTERDGIMIVENVSVSVFDTIYTANSLSITRSGLLFAAYESGDHSLYQFQGLGEDAEVVTADSVFNEALGDDATSASTVAPLFTPSTMLKNLVKVDSLASLAGLTDMAITHGPANDFGDGNNSNSDGSNVMAMQHADNVLRMHALCGKGHRSTWRVLKYGSKVLEMARTDLPGTPIGVWTLKTSNRDEYDNYIVVAFKNKTVVLSIGDTVEEVNNAGFLLEDSTLGVHLMSDDSIVQVHTKGIRQIRNGQPVAEWQAPANRNVTRAKLNSQQVVISLDGSSSIMSSSMGDGGFGFEDFGARSNKYARGSTNGGEVMYFELDAVGNLSESSTLEVPVEVSAIDIGTVPSGRTRFPFIAVACVDDTVQVLSLDPSDMMQQRGVLQVSSRPDSLCFVASSLSSGADSLYLNIGLQNGVLVRVATDFVTGKYSDSRERFLGPKSVSLTRIVAQEQSSLLALSTKSWVMYHVQGRYCQAPLTYEILEGAAPFSSESCPEGIVAISGNSLRIIGIDEYGSVFNQDVVPLRYTPRKMAAVLDSELMVIIESDQHEYNEEERKLLHGDNGDAMNIESNSKSKGKQGEDDDDEDDEDDQKVEVRGPIPDVDGKWASCIRVVDTLSGESKSVLELSGNQAAFSLCTCVFSDYSPLEKFVVVGISMGLKHMPRSFVSNCIHVYSIDSSGNLTFVHSTEIEDVPLCMAAYQGRVLVSVGNHLRMYDMSKSQLITRAEVRSIPTTVIRIQTVGDHIFVGDIRESVFFVKYKREENVLSIFADDELPR